jgi:hypothetical protein
MIAPDGISPLARYAALVAEVPVIRLAEPDAVALGLREGQIVQGSVQARGDQTLFLLNGRFFDLPPALQRVSPGDPRWFRVTRQGEAFVLKVLPPLGGADSSATSVETRTVVAGASATLIQRTAQSSETSVSVRHMGLLSSSTAVGTLASVLAPGRLESQLIDAGALDIARALALSRLRSDGLSASAIEQAVARSGLWGEAALAAGRSLHALDLKMILRQISRLLAARSGGDADDIDDAVDDIERKQLDAVQQSSDGRQVFSVALPFADAPPVSVRFERHSRGDSRGDGSYSIDIHVAPPQTGDIWLKTVVTGTRVDVNVWARRAEVARVALAEERGLSVSLEEAGLSLRAFRVLEGDPPGVARSPAPVPVSTLGLDVKA